MMVWTGYNVTKNIIEDINPAIIPTTHQTNIISSGMVIGSVMNIRISNSSVSVVFMIVQSSIDVTSLNRRWVGEKL